MTIRCVGGIIRDETARILLVRRGLPPSQGLWSLPGGKVEPGESDAAALRRELLEETGLTAVIGPPAGRVTRATFEIYDYHVRAQGEPRAGDDAADVRWVAPDELVRLALTPGLLEALTAWGVI